MRYEVQLESLYPAPRDIRRFCILVLYFFGCSRLKLVYPPILSSIALYTGCYARTLFLSSRVLPPSLTRQCVNAPSTTQVFACHSFRFAVPVAMHAMYIKTRLSHPVPHLLGDVTRVTKRNPRRRFPYRNSELNRFF